VDKLQSNDSGPAFLGLIPPCRTTWLSADFSKRTPTACLAMVRPARRSRKGKNGSLRPATAIKARQKAQFVQQDLQFRSLTLHLARVIVLEAWRQDKSHQEHPNFQPVSSLISRAGHLN